MRLRLLISCLLALAVPISFAQAFTVDFNSRSGGTAIPAGLVGTNIGGLSSSSDLAILPTAGLMHTRLFVDVNQDCPAGTCGTWSIPLAQLALLGAQGLKVTAVFYNTPSNLGANTCTPPSNNTTWAGYVNTGLEYWPLPVLGDPIRSSSGTSRTQGRLEGQREHGVLLPALHWALTSHSLPRLDRPSRQLILRCWLVGLLSWRTGFQALQPGFPER